MIIIEDILSKIKYSTFIGNTRDYVVYPVTFDENNTFPEKLMWVNNKNQSKLKSETQGTIICQEGTKIPEHPKANFILVENPRDTFRIILEIFFKEKQPVSISKTAQIDPSCVLGDQLFIGHNVVIEKDCRIGNNTSIGHNSVLLSGTIVGNHVTIGCNCTLGGIGFGYEKNAEGVYQVMTHLGNVLLEDYVEVGNNTTIDRAVLGSTHIKNNVKIDNQVHIAHGVEIGENSLVIANSVISGSTKIGKNVWVAPSSSILNKLNIKDNAYIGIGSVVIWNVKENEKIFGNPARPIE
jgi:UDP-3-O-[3-hydroxymyristoyl] glucosamine N-acyltransferase